MNAILPVLIEQAASDRVQRERVAKAVFLILAFQSAGMFGMMLGVGFGKLSFPTAFYTYALPSWFLEMTGMAYFIVRSLFASSSLHVFREMLGGTVRSDKDEARIDQTRRLPTKKPTTDNGHEVNSVAEARRSGFGESAIP